MHDLRGRLANPLLPAAEEEASMLPAPSDGLRTLSIQERSPIQLGQQVHHSGLRLCQQRNLQLSGSLASSFPQSKRTQTDCVVAGAKAIATVHRRHIVVSDGLLDARLNRQVSSRAQQWPILIKRYTNLYSRTSNLVLTISSKQASI